MVKKGLLIMIKILFQGDSITDMGRDREDIHSLGWGYPRYAAPEIRKLFEDVEFEFIDKGISGNQTKDLVERLDDDFIQLKPDIVSILIGINDVWHHAGERDWLSDEQFEKNYRTVLEALKNKTDAKIMMIEPFLIPVDDKLFFREDLYRKIEVVRKLAREYADVYLPLDGLLQSAFIKDEPTSYAEDGVHPTEKGARFIAGLYAEYISPLISEICGKDNAE